MEEVRQDVLVFLLAAAFLLAVGCGQGMICAAPNVVIGNACCLDADDDGVCDAVAPDEAEAAPEEPAVEEQPVEAASPYDAFAEKFAKAWDGKSYNALRGLFVRDLSLKFSPNEFNFLARKIDSQLGIRQVMLIGVDGSTARYKVTLPDREMDVYASIKEEGGEYRHSAFYFFANMSADAACGEDGACFMSFATISGDRNFCEKAGALKADCVEKFGVSKSMTEKIEGCMEVTEYYTRADCLTQLAVKENDIEPCWQAGYDKQVFECMGLVAAVRGDVDQCPEFVSAKGYAGTRIQRAYCILGYVKETTDTDACAKIDRRGDVMLGSMQEGCYKLNFP